MAIYQNWLALHYLLAEEGRVYGKFSSSECCIGIDDHGDTIKNNTATIGKLRGVPVQRSTPLLKTHWWHNLLGGWWKKVLFIVGSALMTLIFLPCMILCLIRLISRIVRSSLEELSDEKIERIMKVRVHIQKEILGVAKETYEKYQPLRKLYKAYESPA